MKPILAIFCLMLPFWIPVGLVWVAERWDGRTRLVIADGRARRRGRGRDGIK